MYLKVYRVFISNLKKSLIFFYVGPPKEDIFFEHLLWSIFQSTSHITYHKFPAGPLRVASMYCFSPSCPWIDLHFAQVFNQRNNLHPKIPKLGFFNLGPIFSS